MHLEALEKHVIVSKASFVISVVILCLMLSKDTKSFRMTYTSYVITQSVNNKQIVVMFYTININFSLEHWSQPLKYRAKKKKKNTKLNKELCITSVI